MSDIWSTEEPEATIIRRATETLRKKGWRISGTACPHAARLLPDGSGQHVDSPASGQTEEEEVHANS